MNIVAILWKSLIQCPKGIIIFSASFPLFSWLYPEKLSSFFLTKSEDRYICTHFKWCKLILNFTRVKLSNTNFIVWQRRWGDTAGKMPIFDEIRNRKLSVIWKLYQKSFQTMCFTSHQFKTLKYVQYLEYTDLNLCICSKIFKSWYFFRHSLSFYILEWFCAP